MLLEFYMVFMFFFNITGQMATNEEKSYLASNNDGNKRDVSEKGTSEMLYVLSFNKIVF